MVKSNPPIGQFKGHDKDDKDLFLTFSVNFGVLYNVFLAFSQGPEGIRSSERLAGTIFTYPGLLLRRRGNEFWSKTQGGFVYRLRCRVGPVCQDVSKDIPKDTT